ncbi:MAG: hypothetical protein II992_06115 [Lachnospiraceae bacterium]|nr:hypothetical protein [Lachnospiraceae bacterium]
MTSLMEKSKKEKFERKQKRKEKIIKIIKIGGSICFVLGVIIFVYFQMNRTFNSYVVIDKVERKDSLTAQYITYEGNILKYSRDGATAISPRGEIIWNGSYDMKNPYAVTCGSYVAIADIGGKEVYVYNGTDSGTRMELDYPIEEVAVAKQGVVALVLKKGKESEINIYDPYNAAEQLKVSISTSTDADGFPVSIALSKDGKKLVTSYLNVKNAVLQNSINFYNFGEIGKNSVDRIVGSRALDEEIAVDIEFLTETTVCVYTQEGFKLYRMKETPQDIKEIKVEDNIKSLIGNEDYIAMVLENDGEIENPYRLEVYDLSGERVLEKDISFSYEQIAIDESDIVFFSGKECNIIRINGTEKLNCEFDTGIAYFFGIKNSDKYIVIDEENIHLVRLSTKDKGGDES